MTEKEGADQKVFVLCDLETTGTKPARDLILEVAAVHLPSLKMLQPGHSYSKVCRFRLEDDDCPPIADIVHTMHQENGLWEACRAAPEPTSDVLLDFADWLACLGGCDSNVVLVGNSVHFDRSFLAERGPETLTRMLSHRVVDVSGIKMIAQAWRGDVVEATGGLDAPDSSHRALADCYRSLGLLRRCQRTLEQLP